jgi:hypothetical protein
LKHFRPARGPDRHFANNILLVLRRRLPHKELEAMLSTDQINDLYRLYWSEHWPIRRIERHLKMGWKTIRKYLDAPAQGPATRIRPTKLDAFKGNIAEWLEKDPAVSVAVREAPALRRTPPLIVWISFRLAIPRRVSLQQGPRFTSRPPVCCTIALQVERFSSNDQLCLNCLCQPRGQAQTGLRPRTAIVSIRLKRDRILSNLPAFQRLRLTLALLIGRLGCLGACFILHSDIMQPERRHRTCSLIAC